MSFEAGGVIRTIRPTFATLDALEQAIGESIPQDEITKHGTGMALLLQEMAKPAPRMGLIGRVVAVLLAKADPPIMEPASHEVICEGGLMSWLVDPTQPQAWGVLPRFVHLAQYGPDALAQFLAEEEALQDKEDAPESSKKKSEARSHSRGGLLSRLRKFWA